MMRRSTTRMFCFLLADGWPALIGLAALSPAASMPGQTVPDELYGFFAEELYRAVPSEIRQAFIRLALSPYVTLDIAEAVVGDRAGETLGQGVEFGFFASSPRDRLELHPLLRPFLASKFRRRQDDPTGQLVTELVDMLIGLEEWDDVFSLALRFRDERALIKLFEASLAQMLEQARLPTLANSDRSGDVAWSRLPAHRSSGRRSRRFVEETCGELKRSPARRLVASRRCTRLRRRPFGLPGAALT